MNVILRRVGIVKVDHKFNIFDIETASGDIGGDENSSRTIPELCQDSISLGLGLVTVDREGFVASSTDGAGDVVHLKQYLH